MYDFELEERAAENAAAPQYNALYHGFPLTDYWDDDFFDFVRSEYEPGDRVLDVGCGPASSWSRWQRLPELSALVGVDISEGMIAEAKRAHPDGDFRVARAHELPFSDGSFDVIVASAVLHHIPDDHLPAALLELERVLDEHGRIVGREPSRQPFGHEPGWFSGAIMTFRHLAYRLTRSREFHEPALGDHHHVFDPDRFLALVQERFTVNHLQHRFPFSPFVLRTRSEHVAAVARHLDALLGDRVGAMFYYVADRNYAEAADVSRVVASARRERGISDEEFLAYLEVAAKDLERILGSDD